MTQGRQNELHQQFREIVKNYSDRIYNLALMKCNQVTLAEDICQVTFIRVYKGLPKFREEAQLGTWIYRIALNVCYTMIKKESQLSSTTVPFDDTAGHEVLEKQSDLEEDFIKETQKYEIRKAIATLSTHQADAITLYYLKDFQYTEVAEIMDIPINTVKSHIRRAKANLQKLLVEVHDET